MVFLGSSPYSAPALYSLMSALDFKEGVYYPRGTMYAVVESLHAIGKGLGIHYHFNANVTAITTQAKHATGIELDGKKEVAGDIIISNADLHHTETTLLEPAQQTYPAKYWDEHVPGPSALLLYLGVEGELPELEHHTLLFTKEWEKGFDAIFGANSSVPDPASLYVCKPSGVDPDVAPDGFENLFVLVPIPADPSIGRGDVDGDGDARIEAMADKVIAQIGAWTGIPDLASRVTVRRTLGPGDFASDLNAWRGTALGPAHTLKQSAFFRAGNRSKKVRGCIF